MCANLLFFNKNKMYTELILIIYFYFYNKNNWLDIEKLGQNLLLEKSKI